MGCSLLGSSVHGISQARVLEWVAISFSRGSSQLRDRTRVSHIVGRRFARVTREEYCNLTNAKWNDLELNKIYLPKIYPPTSVFHKKEKKKAKHKFSHYIWFSLFRFLSLLKVFPFFFFDNTEFLSIHHPFCRHSIANTNVSQPSDYKKAILWNLCFLNSPILCSIPISSVL